ncbi:MAG: DUF2975 domain-containing protein [Eubacteriales bacterium]|nr:DUF2975 domain-containing protein [Eubacteriales bacterium]
MKTKTASWLLKIVLAFSALVVLAVAFWAVPQYMAHVVYVRPSLSPWVLPMKACAGLIALPVLAAIVLLWRVFGTIPENEAFSMQNAKRFQMIAWLSVGDLLLVLLLAVFLFVSHAIPAFILMCLSAAVYIGVVAAIVFSVLAALVRNAAEMKQDNELTI